MKRLLVALLIAVVFGPASTDALTTPRLAMGTAQAGTRRFTKRIMVIFTETPPVIKMRCKRKSVKEIMCHVTATGDRAHIRFVADVRGSGSDGGGYVYGSHLKALP